MGDAVSAVCAHPQEVIDLLSGILAWVPVASAIAWVTAKYAALPGWAQRLLQALALNFLHAIAGEPRPPAPK